MFVRTRALAWSVALLAQFVLGITALSAQETAPAPAPAPQARDDRDDSGIEVITVTARKKEEALQDIPIAVSAFSADDLGASNIDDVADVQFNVPNLKFSKTNFSGAGNISLRGVGNLAVAATSEAGTGIHVNTVPFPGARVFETEFYDVDRIEVLRGPQGTLFGRSAPGGTLNVYTKVPVLEEFGGYFQGEYGYYNHGKVRAALNVPINEHLGARFAGYYFHRDGTTHNRATGNRIDGRDVYAIRGSLHGEWDDATFTLMAQYFKKDDDSMRINKQGCTPDPNSWPFSIGCLGGSNKLQRGSINYDSTLGYSGGVIVDSFHVFSGGAVPRFLSGPLAVFTPYLGPGVFGTAASGGITTSYVLSDALGNAIFGVPATAFGAPSYGLPTPYYNGSTVPASSRQVSTQFDPRYRADEIEITFEVNFDLTEQLQLTSVTGWHKATVFSMTDYWWSDAAVPFDGGPRSFDFTDSNLGGLYESEFVFDRSRQNDQFFSQEVRLATSFDGPLNAIVGAIFNDGELDSDYYVWAASLESVWDMPGDPIGLCPAAAAITSLGGSCHDANPHGSRYLNETKPTTINSYALFGELYADILEDTRLTVGARYTDDKKTDTQRVNLWTCDPSGAVGGDFCGGVPFETREGGWTKVTWKVSLDHHFDLPFAPESLIYATVSTGYKGGGFNPAVDASQSGGTAGSVPLEFTEESITSYEIGYKGMLFDQMTFNLTGFFYDYEGMQISKIVNRTAVNENVDSNIWGVEVETFWQPFENARLDLNVSWLKTEIQKGQSIDAADPTAGTPGWIPVKQLLPFPAGQNSVCDPSINALCLDPVVINNPANGFTHLIPELPAPCQGDGITPFPIQGVACGYQSDGFAKNLKGRELPAAPEWSIKVGAQYTLPFFAGWDWTPRVDYYWQAETWGRFYNTAKDKIGTWQQVDASMIWTKEGSPFVVELWAKNLQDNDDITGHYFTDATSANFTNLFILEPRTYGISVRYTFGESEL